MTDIERGQKALKRYHYHMRTLHPYSFKYSFEEMMTLLRKLKGAKTIDNGLGGGIRETNLSDSKVDEAMKSIAIRSGGKIPSSYMDFFFSLTDQSRKIDFVDAASFVIVESAKDVASGAESFGGSVLTSLKTLNALLPLIVVGGALFLVASKLNGATGGDLAKALKGLKK